MHCSVLPQVCEFVRTLASDRTAELRVHTMLCYGLFAYGASQLVTSFFLSAPYGRYSSSNWGPKMPAKLGWLVQECPAFLVSVYLWRSHGLTELTSNPVHCVLMLMFLWHYFYRSFIYPFYTRGQSSPLLVIFMAISFCTWNGYLQGRWLSYLSPAYPASWFKDPRFIVGFVAFCSGWYINFEADIILRNLRKPGETGYKIPRGGMYDYVSAANYFGEILEWCGWALASWSLPTASFAFFVACFLGTRGLQHHRWYLEKFKGEYPKNRKAIIPFIL